MLGEIKKCTCTFIFRVYNTCAVVFEKSLNLEIVFVGDCALQMQNSCKRTTT